MEFVHHSDGLWLKLLLPLQLMAAHHHRTFQAREDDHVPSLLLWTLLLAALITVLFLAIVSSSQGTRTAAAVAHAKCNVPGPRGLPVVGSLLEFSGCQPHRRLAELAKVFGSRLGLIQLRLGETRLIVASQPQVAREILNSYCFADRPLKQSAGELLFGRAIGFAPQGDYWRGLRRIASRYLFSPRRIAVQEYVRQEETSRMIAAIHASSAPPGGGVGGGEGGGGGSSSSSSTSPVTLRSFIQLTSLNTIMCCVFGYNLRHVHSELSQDVQSMVKEGYELLGAFNWADHLHWLKSFDPLQIHQRCEALVSRVHEFVSRIIKEHKSRKSAALETDLDTFDNFVDVLLSLEAPDRLTDEDIVAILWEMIFRGTDTTSVLTEWVMAELILHPEVQNRLWQEIHSVVPAGSLVQDEHTAKMSYLQAVVKETLRLHPPGPLLSWSRLCTEDSLVAGYHVPKGTHAMVNMWAITHDPSIWSDAESFQPERFLGGAPESGFDVKGSDLRLAPFGAGRRVCPGRILGLTTVHLWVARLVQEFEWRPHPQHPVELEEVLKLSSEMAKALVACPISRR